MKKMKTLGMMVVGLLAVSSLSAQTEKGDWAQFGRYAEANKQVQIPANVVFHGQLNHRWLVAGRFDLFYSA